MLPQQTARASRHANERRRYVAAARDAAPRTPATHAVRRRTACTIVPLYPNELTPLAGDLTASPDSCAQNTPPPPPASNGATCALSSRSCAHGAARCHRSPSDRRSSPVSPAAGSACPMLAFTPLTATTDAPRAQLQSPRERAHLDRIAERRARAVSLAVR